MTQIMKNFAGLLILLFVTSCAPNGTEEDALRHEKEKKTLSPPTSGTERYYINQAYKVGQLDKDTIGDYTTALLYLDSAISINPSNMEAYRLKAFVTSLLGEKEKALSIIEEALKIDSTDPENYMSRAGLLIGLERRNEGLKDYYKVVEMDATNGRAHEAIGYMEISKGNKTLGCNHLSKARDLGHVPENRESDKYICK